MIYSMLLSYRHIKVNKCVLCWQVWWHILFLLYTETWIIMLLWWTKTSSHIINTWTLPHIVTLYSVCYLKHSNESSFSSWGQAFQLIYDKWTETHRIDPLYSEHDGTVSVEIYQVLIKWHQHCLPHILYLWSCDEDL